MTDIKNIFFDLDRTLWDFESNSAETLRELFDEFKLAEAGILTPSQFIETYICKNDHCWELYRLNKISKAELRNLRFQMAFEEFGIKNENLAKRMGDAYVDRSPLKTRLFPNTVETLQYLSEKYTLHIITNGFEEVQYIKMEASGIHSFFKYITTSERAGHKKPDERIFRHALAIGNASAYNSVMIGDDEEVDVRGALNIGMKAILFQPAYTPSHKKEYPVITDLNELKQIF